MTQLPKLDEPNLPVAAARPSRGFLSGIRAYLQDRPGLLVLAWKATESYLPRLKKRFESMGLERASRWVRPLEDVAKRPLFDCQMCGQCILHSTGMTCPMTCPKQLRNGPCGGVGLDGSCEVKPEMDCVWVQAVERSKLTPYADEIGQLNPPVDWQLQDQAAWVTFAIGRDQITTGVGTGPHHASEVIG